MTRDNGEDSPDGFTVIMMKLTLSITQTTSAVRPSVLCVLNWALNAMGVYFFIIYVIISITYPTGTAHGRHTIPSGE